MEQSRKAFYSDDEVDSAVLGVIRDAKRHAVIVTPYLGLWGHAKDELRIAAKSGVRVEFLVRYEDDPQKQLDRRADIEWLQENRIKVQSVPGLHAKIYLNEHSVVIGSINFTKGSFANSREIAILVADPALQTHIRDYVDNTLRRLAEPVENVQQQTSRPSARARDPRAPEGVCIRCRADIALDQEKPLCDNCYNEWAQWKNENYPEKFCHACGKETMVTYAKPLCDTCYRSRP